MAAPLDAAERAALAPGAHRTCYAHPRVPSRAVVTAEPAWSPRVAVLTLAAAVLLLGCLLRMRSAWRHLAIWRRLRAAAAAMPRAVARLRVPRNGRRPR
jgi:hypothetical protein